MKVGITVILMLISVFSQTTEIDYRNDIQLNVGKSMYEFLDTDKTKLG
jgi:hypothetical protein